MKFIKASERLPEDEGTYYCKYDNEKYCLTFDGHDFLFAIGEPIPNEEIEWLDESIEPCATSSRIEELEKENEALKQRISEIVYLSEQKGGYHP